LLPFASVTCPVVAVLLVCSVGAIAVKFKSITMLCPGSSGLALAILVKFTSPDVLSAKSNVILDAKNPKAVPL